MHVLQNSILDRFSLDKLEIYADNHLLSNITNKQKTINLVPIHFSTHIRLMLS